MKLELDHKIVQVLESALVAASFNANEDAKKWAQLAPLQKTPECRQSAENMAALYRAKADCYQETLNILQMEERKVNL